MITSLLYFMLYLKNGGKLTTTDIYAFLKTRIRIF
ncbi:hypothetical protein T06_10161 [Trichinella sp. T6]|nr:hypothetical protein T06_10161 [Trichinella sp. T6]